MRILFVSSEITPFAKTGGLADVAGALPRYLARQGHDVRLAMPLYGSVDRYRHRLLPLLPQITIEWGGESIEGGIMRCPFPAQEEIPVYFVQQDPLFDREGLYGRDGADYPDNAMRFGFFSLAVLWMLKGLDWQPDIIHLHDWQTGFIPILHRYHPIISNDPFYQPIKTIFTIHNLAYQGLFAPDTLTKLSLPWTTFTPDGSEFHGRFSAMKSGLVYADYLTTVSPTYAREIQTPEHGAGLEGILQARSDRLTGILNGIDEEVWDPRTDPYLPAHYSAEDLEGKARCRKALLREFRLEADSAQPVIGLVSRLTPQKGFDLVLESLHGILRTGARCIVLGVGDPQLQKGIEEFSNGRRSQVAARFELSEPLAHLIEAGSDIFLMPSYYEPSGLNQLYSMRYGTIPIVRKVGGLSDSVVHATPSGILRGRGTGFVFREYDGRKLLSTYRRAFRLYHDERTLWERLMRNAMKRDFSWSQSALEYEKVYEQVAASRPLVSG